MTAVGRWADPRKLDRLPARLQLLPAYGFLRPRGKATASAGCGEGPQQSSGSWVASHLSGIHGTGGHVGGGSRLCPGGSQLRGGGAATRCGEASLCGGWADVWDPKKVRVGEGVAAPGDGTEVEAGVWGAALAACTVTPEPWGVCG